MSAGGRAFNAAVEAGSEVYERTRHLPRILPVTPDDLSDESVQGKRRILAKLARALRAERNRGRAGHWTYDLNRHIALAQAFRAEGGSAGGPAVGDED